MHEEMPCSSDGVQCPVCCRHCLVERNGVILCPSGDLRLDLRKESLSLEHVRCALGCIQYHTALQLSEIGSNAQIVQSSHING